MTTRSDSPIRRTFSRRTFAGGAAAALAAPALLRAPRSAAAATNLDFVIWNYAEDIVQDNINIFQEANPDVTRQAELDSPGTTFHETMVNRFRSKTPTDVTYNGGNWLEEFAAAGWVVPLDDHFDWVAGYKDKVLPFAWQDMTYNGKVYGLPYYADTITFMYNAKILEDAGITAPPQTWDEVTEQALTLKEKRDGAPVRLRVRQHPAECQRGLRQHGLRPRRRADRRGAESALDRSGEPGRPAAALAGRRQERARHPGHHGPRDDDHAGHEHRPARLHGACSTTTWPH